ncbi:ferredoxin-fold anticodon-binding domain-containing protein 1 isoform X2 [Augochlora pura]
MVYQASANTMKLALFNKYDSVLLVGEGNFSFSVALFQLNLNITITVTCYQASITEDVGKKNIEYLLHNGVRVLLGVDATNLKKYPMLATKLFDKIIFNFPHVGGKMRIEKNRELLKQFFVSATELLKSNGQILVTLCNGQGGTSVDNPLRRWDDTWKITEMAAHANLVLSTIEPFAWSLFPTYIVTGYRGLDKQFHSEKALTHVFVKSEPPNVQNIAPKKKINNISLSDDSFLWKNICQIMNISNTNLSYTHTYTFDITFSVNGTFNSIDFYVLLYNFAGCIISDIKFIRLYEFPIDKVQKRTYRISYKSDSLPLYRKRIIDIHQNLIARILEDNLNVSVSR